MKEKQSHRKFIAFSIKLPHNNIRIQSGTHRKEVIGLEKRCLYGSQFIRSRISYLGVRQGRSGFRTVFRRQAGSGRIDVFLSAWKRILEQMEICFLLMK